MKFTLSTACLSSLLLLSAGGATGLRAQVQATKADAKIAAEAYQAGGKLMQQKDLAAAQTQFAHAATLDPTHREYALAESLTRNGRIASLVQQSAKARLASDDRRAEALLAEAAVIDPGNELLTQRVQTPATTRTRIDLARAAALDFAGPIQLQPDTSPHDLHLRGDPRSQITVLAQTFGIKTTFDDAPNEAPPPVRFDLEHTTYAEAMPIYLRMTHQFVTPIDSKTIFVARDNQENRFRLERQVEETIYVPGSTPEQLAELQNIIKNVFDVQKIALQPGAGSLFLRAPEATLKAVNYTISDLIDGDAEVALDVKLVSVDRSHTRNTGLQTPGSANAFSLAAEAQNLVSANQAFINQAIAQGAFKPSGDYVKDLIAEAFLLIAAGLANDPRLGGIFGTFGHGLTLSALSVGPATLNLALNQSDARALDDITLRTANRQQAVLRVGSKYPITTASYASGLTSAQSSALKGVTINGVSASQLANQFLGTGSQAVVPQFQFEDLGITLKATPVVQKSGNITIALDLKIEALTGASANGVPVLTSRAFTSSVTLEEGATALVLSDLSSNEARAVSGLPGVGDLPGLQQSAADTLAQKDSSELVLTITPHVVRRRSSIFASKPIVFQTSVPQDF